MMQCSNCKAVLDERAGKSLGCEFCDAELCSAACVEAHKCNDNGFPHKLVEGGSCDYCGQYYALGECPALVHPARVAMTERIKAAADKAQYAFWASIVESYPSATHGDFPPDAHFAFGEACESAVETWVLFNVVKEGEAGDQLPIICDVCHVRQGDQCQCVKGGN